MATRMREDRRLRLLSAVCLALPEAERTDCGAHADFRIRGRIFAYFLRNHNGDGITAACFKSRLGEHVEHVKRAPDRFYLPQYLGRRGWFGLRLDLGEINWEEVAALAEVSYRLVARKGLRSPPPDTDSNALTARSLVRGPPPPVIDGSQQPESMAQRVDGNLLDPQAQIEERMRRDDPLRPAAVPRAAISKRAGVSRGRR
jgi:predicted DNA-binding protein (MmcQ/YjbR family)